MQRPFNVSDRASSASGCCFVRTDEATRLLRQVEHQVMVGGRLATSGRDFLTDDAPALDAHATSGETAHGDWLASILGRL